MAKTKQTPQGETDAGRLEQRAEDGALHDAELEAFLGRIGLNKITADALPRGSLELLQLLVVHAVRSIAFEQLDVALGRGINIEPEVVWEKIVVQRRGGYCFENNLLMALVLPSFGFGVQRRLGRVVIASISPMTHSVSLVTTTDELEYLVDIGFGAQSPPGPVPMADAGTPRLVYPYAFRFVPDTDGLVAPGGVVVQAWDAAAWVEAGKPAPTGPEAEVAWKKMYAFHPEHKLVAIDAECGNYWVSTKIGGNTFTETRIAVLQRPQGRVIVHHAKLIHASRVSNEDLELLFPGADIPAAATVPEGSDEEQNEDESGIYWRTSRALADDEYLPTLSSELGLCLDWDHRTSSAARPVTMSSFTTAALEGGKL